MFYWQDKNLLPKETARREALKALISQKRLSKWGFLRKSSIVHFYLVSSKPTAALLLLLYFFGYNPAPAISPIRQTVVQAQTSPLQTLTISKVTQTFNLPFPGIITTYYSSWHPGVDIATGLGTPIRPIANGVVSEVHYGFFGLGHYVVIQHDNGYQSTYGHMGSIFVNVGDHVNQTSYIGEVGLTGHTTGPHTHLEIKKDGQYINPLTVLPPIPDFSGKLQYY